MNRHSFAIRLNRLREEAELSQYELAKRTGLTRQTLSRLEKGESVPTWPTVQLLALALGVACTTFLDSTLQLPNAAPVRRSGRPRKITLENAPSKKDADVVKPAPVQRARKRRPRKKHSPKATQS